MSGKGDFYPVGANMFIANMQYAADVHIEGKLTVDLTPNVALNAANATYLLSAQSIATASSSAPLSSALQDEANMGKFGRSLTVVASGAATSNVTIHGLDYLGQPMSESFTLTGAVSVAGGKAFRRVTSIVWGATGATTINVGVGDKLGLPYAYLDAGVEVIDGIKTAGTFVVPALTAQLVTSTDPRGTLTPSAAPNASRRYMVMYEPRRGALYGVRHFFSG